MFLVPICCIFKFKKRFVNFKRIQATPAAFPEIQDGGQKEIIRGKFKYRFFKVKATVLSLLSCIFVMLNSNRLRCDMFRLFPSSEPKTQLTEFERKTADQVKSLINSCRLKNCILDPLPASVIKDCTDVLLPVLTKMINISIETANVLVPLDIVDHKILLQRLSCRFGINGKALRWFKPPTASSE